MRDRLRPAYDDAGAFYSGRYPGGYRHAAWPDHVERVAESVKFIETSLITCAPVLSVADLSCGDGAITWELNRPRTFTGDLNPVGPERPAGPGTSWITGSLPGTLDSIPGVDLYICSETLEHLDDPDGFLALLRPKARLLFVSTPEAETGQGNPEHYWGWDSEAVRGMLTGAGWTPMFHRIFTPVSADVYRFQMWMCR